MTTSGVKAAAVVYNPAKIQRSVLEQFVLLYADPQRRIEWIATSPDNSGESQVASLSASDFDVVLVAGGDGTVRCVAAALANKPIKLAVVPVGTGNLLARNLGMQIDLETSIRRAFNGEVRRIDFCRVKLVRPDGANERLGFVVMAGLGLDAEMLEATDERLKRRLGPIAYVSGIVKSLRIDRRTRVVLSLDGQRVVRTKLHTLLFGNCGDLISRIPLFPRAKPDDGLIDVAAISPRGLTGWVRVGTQIIFNALKAKAPFNTVLRAPNAVEYWRARRVVASFSQPQVFEVDGDPIGEVTDLELQIIPGAITVCV